MTHNTMPFILLFYRFLLKNRLIQYLHNFSTFCLKMYFVDTSESFPMPCCFLCFITKYNLINYSYNFALLEVQWTCETYYFVITFSNQHYVFRGIYTKKINLSTENSERNSVIDFPFFSLVVANLESEINAVILYILHLPLHIYRNTFGGEKLEY